MADDFGLGYALGSDSGGGNNGGFGGSFGEGLWAVIILAILFGRGGIGFGNQGSGFGGGGGNGCCCGSPCATQADLAAGFNNSAVLNKLNDLTLGQAGVQQTLCQGFNGVNTTVLQGFNGVDNAICTLGYNIQQGFNTLGYQQKDCCCETQRLIERGFCDTGAAISMQTRDLIDNQNANYRSIMDFLVQEKLASKDAQIAQLQGALGRAEDRSFLAANQEAQTAELIRRLDRNPCPVPAYVVPNPNCCYGNPVGIGYGNSGGCGCGCG